MRTKNRFAVLVSCVFVYLFVSLPNSVSGQIDNNVESSEIVLPLELISKIAIIFSNKPSCICKPFIECTTITPTRYVPILIAPRFGTNKCKFDGEICCPVVCEGDVTTTQEPVALKLNQCGIHTPGGNGGQQSHGAARSAGLGEFPWMTAIFREQDGESEFVCGGSLIHSQAVLTAAHCVVSSDSSYHVRVGEYNPKANDETWTHQDRRVVHRIIHSRYYSGALRNDIALIILDRPVKFRFHIQPICLPIQDEIVISKDCFVTGWGTNPQRKNKIFSGLLQVTKLSMVPSRECQEVLRTTHLGANFRLHDTAVCAGGEGADACKGDGGGPLVCKIRGQSRRYRQVGIVSWGIGCTKYPGVYTNVPLYVDWIQMKLMEHNLTYSSKFLFDEEEISLTELF